MFSLTSTLSITAGFPIKKNNSFKAAKDENSPFLFRWALRHAQTLFVPNTAHHSLRGLLPAVWTQGAGVLRPAATLAGHPRQGGGARRQRHHDQLRREVEEYFYHKPDKMNHKNAERKVDNLNFGIKMIFLPFFMCFLLHWPITSPDPDNLRAHPPNKRTQFWPAFCALNEASCLSAGVVTTEIKDWPGQHCKTE